MAVRTLSLVSPEMRGTDVVSLQKLLQKSVYGNFHPGTLDGVFGESTAGAVKRARWWLGYSHDQATNPKYCYRAGAKLRAYLSGKEKLPALNQLRRKRRIAAAGKVPLREKMLAEAKRHIGVKESPPNSNKVMFSTWYGLLGPWCAMFVTYCGVRVGAKKSLVKGVRYAYTPFMVRDARLGVQGMALVSRDDVKPGHIVMYDFERKGTKGSEYNTDHTGIFEKWLNSSKTQFSAIEGNTSTSNDSNGGEVMRRNRDLGQVIAFIQVEQ